MYSPSLPLQNQLPVLYITSPKFLQISLLSILTVIVFIYILDFSRTNCFLTFFSSYIYTHTSANYTSKKATSVSPLESEDLGGNQGNRWCKFQSKGRREINVAAQIGRQDTKGASSFLFPVLFYSGPQQPGQCPPSLGKAIYITQSTNSNANLILQKHHYEQTQKIFNLGTRYCINLNITHFTLTLVP